MKIQFYGTYPELFLQIDSFGEGRNNIISEISIAPEIEGFQLLKTAKSLEYLAHAFCVDDCIIFESHLNEIFAVFQIG